MFKLKAFASDMLPASEIELEAIPSSRSNRFVAKPIEISAIPSLCSTHSSNLSYKIQKY